MLNELCNLERIKPLKIRPGLPNFSRRRQFYHCWCSSATDTGGQKKSLLPPPSPSAHKQPFVWQPPAPLPPRVPLTAVTPRLQEIIITALLFSPLQCLPYESPPLYISMIQSPAERERTWAANPDQEAKGKCWVRKVLSGILLPLKTWVSLILPITVVFPFCLSVCTRPPKSREVLLTSLHTLKW